MQIINSAKETGCQREKIYPWDNHGVELTAGVDHTWGLPKVCVPIDGIHSNYGYETVPSGILIGYIVAGASIISVAVPTATMSWNVFKIHKGEDVTLTATSGAGEANPEEIYAENSSDFRVHDLVWIADDNHSDGEIRRVDGITGNTLETDAALSYTYTVAANPKVYVIRRELDSRYCAHWGKFSAGGIKNMRTQLFSTRRYCPPGTGLLLGARGLTADNPAGTIAITILYDTVE